MRGLPMACAAKRRQLQKTHALAGAGTSLAYVYRFHEAALWDRKRYDGWRAYDALPQRYD